MKFIASAVLCVVLVEVLGRLSVMTTLRRLTLVAGNALDVLQSSRISDHWKERVLLKYARLIFVSTLKLLIFLLLLALPVYATIAASGSVGLDLYGFLISWQGILFCIVVASGYAKVRFRHA